MPDGLYERDALAWADDQAALLRRLAKGEGVNAAVDWPNVIEEVQDVGLSELRACESLIEQTLIHLLQLHLMPDSQAARHWRDEVQAFRNDLRRRYTPSMRQRLDIADIYVDAVKRVADSAEASRPVPIICPFPLAALIDRQTAVDGLLAMVPP